MKAKTLILSSITGAILLQGCASHYSLIDNEFTRNQKLGSYSPLEIVSQESQRALQAQQTLLKYRQTQTASLDMKQRAFDTDNIVLDYIGKAPALLSSIAIKYGYRFVQVGQPYELPTVNFTRVYGTPADILVNLNSQLNDQANIAIDKNEKLITLIYNNGKYLP